MLPVGGPERASLHDVGTAVELKTGIVEMRQSELRTQHAHEAERLCRLAANATTPRLKALLMTQVEEHERLAERVEEAYRAAAETHDVR